jgi:hypothetical protein
MLKELKTRYYSGEKIDFRLAAYTTIFYCLLFLSPAFGIDYPLSMIVFIYWAAFSFVVLFTIIFQDIEPNTPIIIICLPWFISYIVLIIYLKIINLQYYPQKKWSRRILKQNNYHDFFNNKKYEDLL